MYDVIIRGGRVIDGSGAPGYLADIAVSGNRIAAIGDLSDQKAERVIDATGLVVCPGFIDNHSHGDLDVLADPYAKNEVLQGITTEVVGSCGYSFAPIADEIDRMISGHVAFASAEKQAEILRPMSFPEFLDLVDATPMGTNLVCYMGQGIVRAAVMGYVEGDANEEQLAQMKQIVSDGMEAGAFGLSTGLIYPTGSLTSTEELTALCQVVGKYGGYYSTHMRGESDGILTSLAEAIRITEGSGVHTIISHHKITGNQNEGKSRETLAMIDDANARGMKVDLDLYPYTAGATTLTAAIPREFMADKSVFLEKIKSPEFRRQVADAIENGTNDDQDMVKSCGGLQGVVIAGADTCPQYVGRSITEIAEAEGKDPYDVLFDILSLTDANATAVFFCICESDMLRIMQHPRAMFGTDGSHSTFANFFGHPRVFGTFPHILTEFVKKRGVLTLEEMIHKACGLPAQVLGLSGKGLLKEGYDADIVVMDYENMKVHSDYANAGGKNEGFRYVFNNGQIVVENDECTGILSGKLIRRVPNGQ